MPQLNVNTLTGTTFSDIQARFQKTDGPDADKHVRFQNAKGLYTGQKFSLAKVIDKFDGGARLQQRAEKRAQGAAQIKQSLDNQFGRGVGDRVFSHIQDKHGIDLNRGVTRGEVGLIQKTLDDFQADKLIEQPGARFRDRIQQRQDYAMHFRKFLEKDFGPQLRDSVLSHTHSESRQPLEGPSTRPLPTIPSAPKSLPAPPLKGGASSTEKPLKLESRAEIKAKSAKEVESAKSMLFEGVQARNSGDLETGKSLLEESRKILKNAYESEPKIPNFHSTARTWYLSTIQNLMDIAKAQGNVVEHKKLSEEQTHVLGY